MKIGTVGTASASAATVASAGQTVAGAGGFAGMLQKSLTRSDAQGLDGIFQKASETYGVPVNLLKAVAKTESDFQAGAVSRCGAQGIMQLMPSTAKSLGVTDSFNPEQNIMGGAKYLGSLLGRYGDAKLALAAYNAGSGSVDKYGGVPPYAETQHYVEKVLKDAGQDLTVPAVSASAAESGTQTSSPPLGAGSESASFTLEDYSKFLELLAQQLLQKTMEEPSLVSSGTDLTQNGFLM